MKYTRIINDSIDSLRQRDKEHALAIGDLVLNKETLTVTWRNKRLTLYPQRVRLLEFLILNQMRPISRRELLNNVWSTDIYIEDRTIDRNVERIRDAFKREAKGDPIRTIRHVGYVLNDQFEKLHPPPEKHRMGNAHHLKRCPSYAQNNTGRGGRSLNGVRLAPSVQTIFLQSIHVDL